MTVEQTLATNNATDASDQDLENQATNVRTYTQEEVDNMMARMKGSLEKKLLKPYADLGDPEELRSIKTEWEKRQQEQQVKRGEFEKILQEKAQRWESEIQKRDSIIKDYKVNMPLLSAAAKHNAVNAEQVKALLGNSVRLNAEGDVEVVDDQGNVRYTDQGQAITVDELVRDFLDKNPHFKTAGAATTNTKSNVSPQSSNKVDLASLDMRNPAHRELYKQTRN